MTRPTMPPRTTTRFEIGERIGFSRTFTEADMALFIGVTWDVNPYRTDDVFAAKTKFKKRILPGLLTASMATHLGGLSGFLAQQMTFEFLAPVYVGDTVNLESEVSAVEANGRVHMRARFVNQNGVEVLRGEYSGFPTSVAAIQSPAE